MTLDDLFLMAGTASTVIFVTSYMPMLVKAVRTKDLASYSPTQLVLTNIGNVLYSAYVFSLPLGPIWALHSFYVVTSALMLAWYFRYTRAGRRPVGKVDGPRAKLGATRPREFSKLAAHRALRSKSRATFDVRATVVSRIPVG